MVLAVKAFGSQHPGVPPDDLVDPESRQRLPAVRGNHGLRRIAVLNTFELLSAPSKLRGVPCLESGHHEPIKASIGHRRPQWLAWSSQAPVWYHVFCTRDHPNTPESFSLGGGDTRFAPLKLPDGRPVGTWYAAASERATLLESVLHDVPLDPPGVSRLADLALRLGIHLI